MHIFITGGTGFVGKALTQRLAREGHEVAVLTRSGRRNDGLLHGVSFIVGDPTKKGDWQKGLADYDAIINLAGTSIFSRWTKKNKNSIRDSRILTTKNLVEGLIDAKGKELLLISTSAVGYYGFHEDEELTEESLPGNDFLATVTKDWETEAKKAEAYGARVVICRLGVVLGKGGGALKKMLPSYRWYMGSPLGSGKQWFSWIHMEDLVEIFLFLLNSKDISGTFNCASPNPVTNREMTKALAGALKRPVIMPAVPGFFIRLVMGEFGDTLLKGQRAIPEKLQKTGYRFRFPNIESALDDIL